MKHIISHLTSFIILTSAVFIGTTIKPSLMVYADVPISPVTPFEAWQGIWFSSAEISNPLVADLTSDPDGDGNINIEEYAFNLNPKIIDKKPFLTNRPTQPNDHLMITFPIIKNANDISYIVEGAQSLGDTWSVDKTSPSSSVERGYYIDKTYQLIWSISQAPMGFLRVRVIHTTPPIINKAPLVNAGADVEITTHQVQLHGLVTDDGLPNPPGHVTTIWKVQPWSAGIATIVGQNQLDPMVYFGAYGKFYLTLEATDGLLTSSDTLIITVQNPQPVNQAPIVNAGLDVEITTYQYQLQGQVTDDGLPEAGVLRSSWTKVSGPGIVYFFNPGSPRDWVYFYAPGTYVLRLWGDDGALNSSDDVTITVRNPQTINQAPLVNAGADVEITTYQYQLQGQVTDDGLPEAGVLRSSWTKVSGPGIVYFFNPGSPRDWVYFYAPGTYVLRLWGNDGALNSSDDVTITVEKPQPINQAPIVNAGLDVEITTYQYQLQGQVTDDGLPVAGVLRSSWTKVSGPGIVTFSNPGSPRASVYFYAPGAYVLRLWGDDGALNSFDDVTITVRNPQPVNQAPLVNAGADITTDAAGVVVLHGLVSDDGLPNPPSRLTVNWMMVSTIPLAQIISPLTPDTSAYFPAAGIYILRLSVSDGEFTRFDDVTVVVRTARIMEPYVANDVIAKGSRTLARSSLGESPKIIVQTPEAGLIEVKILDRTGRHEIKTLNMDAQATGTILDGQNLGLPDGVYRLKIRQNGRLIKELPLVLVP